MKNASMPNQMSCEVNAHSANRMAPAKPMMLAAFKLRIGGQFMYQGSTGANLLTGSSFDTWSGGINADLIWGPMIASIAYTQTGRGAAYRTPFGGWAGYTSIIVEDFNRAGENALLFGAALDFASLDLAGLSLFTNAVFGRNAIDATHSGKPEIHNDQAGMVFAVSL